MRIISHRNFWFCNYYNLVGLINQRWGRGKVSSAMFLRINFIKPLFSRSNERIHYLVPEWKTEAKMIYRKGVFQLRMRNKEFLFQFVKCGGGAFYFSPNSQLDEL